MSRITLKLEDEAVRAALERVLRAEGDLTAVMKKIGSELVQSTRDRFQQGVAPDGRPWAPNSPVTIARTLARYSDSFKVVKKKRTQLLTKKGQERAAGKKPLIGESGSLSTQISYAADRRSVAVGSPMVYAAVQQFGARQGAFGRGRRGAPIPWGDIPARPFLGLSAGDRVTIVALIADHLRRAAGA